MQKQISRLIFLLIVFGFLLFGCSINTSQLESNFEKVDRHQKTKILEKLLGKKQEGHFSFYRLMSMSSNEDIDCFRTALKNKRDISIILDITPYLRNIIKSYQTRKKELLDSGKPEEECRIISDKEHLTKFRKIIQILEQFNPEIASISRTNIPLLIAEGKTAVDNKDLYTYVANGPMIGLLSLKEEGFKDILESMKTENDVDFACTSSEIFGPYAVIPTLKMIENPESTDFQNRSASKVMFAIPLIETTIDKFVEAYQHGRYFPNQLTLEKLKKSDVEKILKIAWWNHIGYLFKDKPEVIKYIGEKYLYNPEYQARMINLMADTDFVIAYTYFARLNFNALSNDALQALEQCFFNLTISKTASPLEYFLLYEQMFVKLDHTKRVQTKFIYSIGYFPPIYQSIFIKANFNKMALEEKSVAIFLASKLKPSIRDSIYTKIKKLCNNDQKHTIEYNQKNI